MKNLIALIKDYVWYLLLALPIIIAFAINKSYYDIGDSIKHYQIIRYAWIHPYLFMDHWGKPFFILLATPFAPFGFKAMALFNSGVIFSSSIIVFKLIKFEGGKAYVAFLAALVFILASNTLPIGHSGLTEPLFGFMLLLAYFWMRKGLWIEAMLTISFLPYVRTEGLIIMAVYGFYLVINQKWRHIPYLFAGYVVYGLIGLLWVYQDFNWLFTQNPYSSDAAIKYGNGEWLHYFIQFYYINGLPFTLLTLGAMAQFFWTFRSNTAWARLNQNQQLFLLYGCGLGFFLSHVVFWKFGIFGSFGMNRILFCIVPIAAAAIGYFLIALHQHLNPKLFSFLYTSILLVVMLFPFSGNKSAWNFQKHFGPNPEIALMEQIVKTNPDWESHLPIAYGAPIVAEYLNIDPFNARVCLPLSDLSKANSVLWDSWFAKIEDGQSEAALREETDGKFALQQIQNNQHTYLYGKRLVKIPQR